MRILPIVDVDKFFTGKNYYLSWACWRLLSLSKPVKFLKPFDVNKISVSQHPDFSGVYVVELPLDSTPDVDWREAFERKWRFSTDLWDSKVYLVNDKIKLLSSVDSFDEKLDWMEKLVDDTNKAVQECNRLIEKEGALVKSESGKQLLHMESSKAVIMDAVYRKFA